MRANLELLSANPCSSLYFVSSSSPSKASEQTYLAGLYKRTYYSIAHFLQPKRGDPIATAEATGL
jgi:hypothetical protein